MTALGTPVGVGSAAADPTADVFWPSKYGADDEVGALNEIGPTNVLRAVGLVRTGRVFDLAHVLDDRVPAFPGRTFRQLLTQEPTRRVGTNQVNWVIEWINAPSQMGTHMDGLNHLHASDRMYNGHRLVDVAAEHGTTRLGIEKLPQVVTRGVLVDVAAVRGVDRLEAGEVITPDDVVAAGVTVRPGDALLFHTGHGVLWDPTASATAPANRAPEGPWPNGWSSTAWPSPAATRGATGPSRPRTPRRPSPSPSGSTPTTG